MHSITEIIDDIRLGKMVIIVDDEDRENEGDLIMAADCVTPDAVNFMITHGRGLFCLPMAASLCQRIGLQPMTKNNGCRFGTNFTVSIEAAEGVSTGISTADRAHTVKTAIANNADTTSIVSPGHVFPLMAREGGVLTRAGHTEAACDLAQLAGFKPAAVLIEILNADGSMARRPELDRFAEQHQLKISSVAALVAYQKQQEDV